MNFIQNLFVVIKYILIYKTKLPTNILLPRFSVLEHKRCDLKDIFAVNYRVTKKCGTQNKIPVSLSILTIRERKPPGCN